MIEIAPQLRMQYAPLDFMAASGTMTFTAYGSELGLGKGGYLFRVSFQSYTFEAGFTPSELYFQRNGYRASLEIEDINGPNDTLKCILEFDPTKLAVTILEPSYEKRIRTISTPPVIPPNEILNWARKVSILPVKRYDSAEDFYHTVLISVQSIQDKIKSSNMYDAFWDFSHEGSKITNRRPKRETSITATVHGLLFDILLLKNIQIYPEHPLAGGNLDFLLSGILQSGEFANACIEFKHAHSQNLENGLTNQLPTYMNANGCKYGIYCPIYFKGHYFNKPDESIPDMEFRLKNLVPPRLYPDINVFTLDLSRPISPSQL